MASCHRCSAQLPTVNGTEPHTYIQFTTLNTRIGTLIKNVKLSIVKQFQNGVSAMIHAES